MFCEVIVGLLDIKIVLFSKVCQDIPYFFEHRFVSGAKSRDVSNQCHELSSSNYLP